MHQDEGAQHGVMTGSGAYREYPQGMVSIVMELSCWCRSHCFIGSIEWAIIGSTEETTG